MTQNIFHIRKGKRPVGLRLGDGDVESLSYSDGTPLHAYDDEVVIPIELASLLRHTLDPHQGDAPKGVKDIGDGARQALYDELRTATGRSDVACDPEALRARYVEATKPKTVRITFEVPETTAPNLILNVTSPTYGGRVVEQ